MLTNCHLAGISIVRRAVVRNSYQSSHVTIPEQLKLLGGEKLGYSALTCKQLLHNRIGLA